MVAYFFNVKKSMLQLSTCTSPFPSIMRTWTICAPGTLVKSTPTYIKNISLPIQICNISYSADKSKQTHQKYNQQLTLFHMCTSDKKVFYSFQQGAESQKQHGRTYSEPIICFGKSWEMNIITQCQRCMLLALGNNRSLITELM